MAERGIDYLTGSTKRRLDVIGGLALAGMLAPVGVVTGLLSAIDTREPNPFFTQDREGLRGSKFRVFKFRTLREASKIAKEGIVTYGSFDPRASKIGQFLRQTGLDELPQLANVLKGQMSLVGARPMIVEDIEKMHAADPKLYEDWYEYYKQSRPGLFGPSQALRHHYLNGTTPELYRHSMAIDLKYLEHATLASDIGLMLRTPIEMLLANIGVIDNTTQVIDLDAPETGAYIDLEMHPAEQLP